MKNYLSVSILVAGLASASVAHAAVDFSHCMKRINEMMPRGVSLGADGKGRVPAVEVLRNLPSVANLIREGKTQQVATIIETHSKVGMQSMDAVLKDMYRKGTITREVALKHVTNPTTLN